MAGHGPSPREPDPRLAGSSGLPLHEPIPGAARGAPALRGRGRRAPPVLFVHGTPTWSYEWRHLIRRAGAALALHRARICSGFGLSERPRALPLHARGSRGGPGRVRRAPRTRRFTLVVHDYGGPIGLPLCLDGPGARSAARAPEHLDVAPRRRCGPPAEGRGWRRAAWGGCSTAGATRRSGSSCPTRMATGGS